MEIFADYTRHGWRLCPIQPGTKGPRNNGWNERDGAITDPAVAANLPGAGLCHAYSGTCALDVDNYEESKVWLTAQNIDLDQLLSAPDAVQISSGRENRCKLIYRMDSPLPSKNVEKGIFELRCGTTTGLTVQDVLPPTVHKDTGVPYTWKGDWRNLPPIPESLLTVWKSITSSTTKPPTSTTSPLGDGATSKEIGDLLATRDPNCGYDEWVRIGMALHHETGGSAEGFQVWDEWSAPGSTYPGMAVLKSHWTSFGRSTTTPVTLASLRRTDRSLATDFQDVSNDVAGIPEPVVTPARYRFLPFLELQARPEPDWIIHGVLPEAGIGAIYGPFSAGKTFLALDLALSVALGQPWRGVPVKKGSVLYVAAEDNFGVQMRLGAGVFARGVQDVDVATLADSPALTSKEDTEELLKAIAATGQRHSLIFLDTLAAVTPGADENSGKDLNLVIDACKRIHKVSGAMVMLVHHEGKTAGRGLRGHTVLPAACDVIINVCKDDYQREMKMEKLKNYQDGAVYPFQLAERGKSCVVDWL